MGFCVDISLTNIIIFGTLSYITVKAYGFYKNIQGLKLLEKWNHTTKNKVILHSIPRANTIPNVSPFVLKVETYFRMASIPYEVDTTDPFGTKGKTPWISYNGTHIADSQLIIDFLNKKLDRNLSKHLTSEQKGIARMARIILEEHFLWGFAKWRWVDGTDHLQKLFTLPAFEFLFTKFLMKRGIKKALWLQGIGRHSDAEINRFTEDDLRSVSATLGTKKFIMGDEPCEEDCGIFGMLSQIVWAAPESSYERLVSDELHNLKHYCFRMKEKFWSDWDSLLAEPA